MSRWYFRIGGAALAMAGVGILFYARTERVVEASAMVALGVGSFAFSFVRSGDRVADAAKTHLEEGAD